MPVIFANRTKLIAVVCALYMRVSIVVRLRERMFPYHSVTVGRAVRTSETEWIGAIHVQEPYDFGTGFTSTKGDDMPTNGLVQECTLVFVRLGRIR